MTIDLGSETLITIIISIIGIVTTLYGRAISAENKAMKSEIDTLKLQHAADIIRINDAHDDIWLEIKCQRESLMQNKEAIIRLNASIDRLNEILQGLEKTINGKVNTEHCKSNHAFVGFERRKDQTSSLLEK